MRLTERTVASASVHLEIEILADRQIHVAVTVEVRDGRRPEPSWVLVETETRVCDERTGAVAEHDSHGGGAQDGEIGPQIPVEVRDGEILGPEPAPQVQSLIERSIASTSEVREIPGTVVVSGVDHQHVRPAVPVEILDGRLARMEPGRISDAGGERSITQAVEEIERPEVVGHRQVHQSVSVEVPGGGSGGRS